MHKHHTNEERKHEGDVRKSAPEAVPQAGDMYEEDDHPATDAPKDHGEIPRKNDDSEDDKKDPYKAS
ncbi:MAG: hypothetical protein QRY16_09705 [Enterobacterales bacterium endosymbiont of Blomia tropicalis]|uniref:hypothetical protein n=1 Tax=Mixta mediterraneensis TaxID=2758443 RepID=UPI0018741A2E|nr:hypothetical protein [Mixta mediterraneensis]MBE5252862.1 hypothetical protein [Mixta mediterraneensis]MDL4914041.1 hypothetical protein [Mixta mediterraneensis]